MNCTSFAEFESCQAVSSSGSRSCVDGPRLQEIHMCESVRQSPWRLRSCRAAGRGLWETRGMADIWVRKPIGVLQAEAKEGEFGSGPGEAQLRRTLSLWSLVALGIGAVIGAGIFVLTGHAAAANAGPAISLSFVLAGIVCV